MTGIDDQPGVVGALVVDTQHDQGGIIYLRYDPASDQTTEWDVTCRAAFNDARAAVNSLLKPLGSSLPEERESRFYAIDWRKLQAKTNVLIEGRSLTLAAALAMISYHTRLPLARVLCTGDLSQDGRVLPVLQEGYQKKLEYLRGAAISGFGDLILPQQLDPPNLPEGVVKVHRIAHLKDVRTLFREDILQAVAAGRAGQSQVPAPASKPERSSLIGGLISKVKDYVTGFQEDARRQNIPPIQAVSNKLYSILEKTCLALLGVSDDDQRKS